MFDHWGVVQTRQERLAVTQDVARSTRAAPVPCPIAQCVV